MDNKPETFEDREQSSAGRQWSGFAEIDHAITEDRLTEYRFKKAWADPWSRRLFYLVGAAVVAFLVFVVVQETI
jgi:hypothetical protein